MQQSSEPVTSTAAATAVFEQVQQAAEASRAAAAATEAASAALASASLQLNADDAAVSDVPVAQSDISRQPEPVQASSAIPSAYEPYAPSSAFDAGTAYNDTASALGDDAKVQAYRGKAAEPSGKDELASDSDFLAVPAAAASDEPAIAPEVVAEASVTKASKGEA